MKLISRFINLILNKDRSNKIQKHKSRPAGIVALATFAFLVAAAALFAAQPVAADTFHVTTSDLSGQGSLLAAVDSANSTAGPDTIDIAEGLRIDLTTNDPEAARGVVRLTESVTIEGNGATVFSNPAWINTAGVLNPIGGGVRCQSDPPAIVASPAMPFLQIGTFGQDNTGIEVTVRNLNALTINNFAIGELNSSLTLDGVHVERIRAISPCDRAVVEGDFRELVIRNTTIEDGYSFRDTIYAEDSYYVFAGVIEGSGNLVIEDVSLIDNVAAGAIAWNRGDVKIVSSRFVDSGGVQILDGEALIVNSAIDLGTNGGGDSWNSIVAGPGGEIDLIASTVYVGFHGDSPDLEGQPLHAAGGVIRLVESAVYGGATADTVGEPLAGRAYYASLGGTFVADDFSWVSPVDDQESSTLLVLFQNNSLLTDPPGLSQDLAVFYPQSITPIAPGVLIDVIDNGTHELLNPIDGEPIQHDVLGNSRVDANGLRNIGAVQLNEAPHLSVAGIGDKKVDLNWTKPRDLVDLCGYSLTSSPGATVEIPDPDTLSYTADRLTNGIEYEFQVEGLVNCLTTSTPSGFPSNIVTATPLGDIGKPKVKASPGDDEVLVSWTQPDLGGRDFDTYQILWRVAGTDAYIGADITVAYGDTSITITGLQNDTEYEFAVAAVASGETGPQGFATATPHGDIGTVNRNPNERHTATKEQNKPKYWENLGYGECTKTEVADDYGSVWYLDADASALILKSGLVNDVWVDPVAGQHGTASAKDISHVIVCDNSQE
jgi:hypothetical protein